MKTRVVIYGGESNEICCTGILLSSTALQIGMNTFAVAVIIRDDTGNMESYSEETYRIECQIVE